MNGKPSRAVILAAGLGTRLRPLTNEMPKPMVPVAGRPIITTILDGLRLAGISEVYIVRGWHGDKMDVLQKDYPEIQFIDNSAYAEANNISSILAAGDRLQDAFVIEGDLYFHNLDVFQNVGSQSNYLAFPVKKTTDWCFYADAEHRITRMAVGGENCWQMVGCSYWTAEDGRRLLRDAQDIYDRPDGHERYWDEVALTEYLGEYDVRVRPCTTQDVIEIDTVEELHALERNLQ